jgi:hypothetical protein
MSSSEWSPLTPHLSLSVTKSGSPCRASGCAVSARGAILTLDERVLAEPLNDEGSREIFPTTGHALLQVVVAHTAFHVRQLAAWRRAIGRAPIGVFV